MQLFILDRSPAAAAQMLCDVHLRKMCLETAQILSGTAFRSGKKLLPGMPQVYNPSHPVIQAINTPFKINWTIDHFAALHQEYQRRFDKTHAYSNLPQLYRELLYTSTSVTEQWDFARAFKDFMTETVELIPAYREYYRFKKSVIKKWQYTNADEPEWLQ